MGGFDKNGGKSQKRTGFRGELKRGADCAVCGLASDRTEGCVWSLLEGQGNTVMLEPIGLLLGETGFQYQKLPKDPEKCKLKIPLDIFQEKRP